MVSTRRFIGKLSRERASSFVLGGMGNRITHRGLKTRIGKRVILDSNNLAVRQAQFQEKTQNAMREFESFIETESKKHQTPKRLEKIQHARELQKLLRNLGQKRITAFQLAATLAFEHGLDASQLKPPLTRLVTLQVNSSERAFWEGTITQIGQAVNKNLPARIESLLEKNKRILDSKEIARALGLSWNKQTLNLINASMQLLDQMGIAEKHFPSASLRFGPAATFSHKMHGALPVTHANAMLEILEATHSAGQPGLAGKKLHKLKQSGNTTSGTAGARFNLTSINRAAKKLEELGLIEKIKIARAGFPAGGFVLTPEGKRVMDDFVRGGRKSNRALNAYLLGEK